MLCLVPLGRARARRGACGHIRDFEVRLCRHDVLEAPGVMSLLMASSGASDGPDLPANGKGDAQGIVESVHGCALRTDRRAASPALRLCTVQLVSTSDGWIGAGLMESTSK